MIAMQPLVKATLAISLFAFGLAEPAQSQSTSVNILLVEQGEVKIKKPKWKTYQKATTGTLLHPDDLLQLSSGSSASLMCGTTKKWKPTPGKEFKVSEGCPRGVASRPRIIARAQTRAVSDPFPYLLSPRNTDILGARPLLKWNPVAGTSLYTVQVQAIVGDDLTWRTETRDSQIIYGGNPLKPGARYLLTVKTDKGAESKAETGVTLMFSLLPTEKAKTVEGEIAAIKQQGLSPEGEALALSYLYEGYNLKAEAIALLEPLVQQKSENPVVYGLLGDLYLQTQLSQKALAAYQQALTLAQKSGDLEGEGLAQAGLGEASFGLGKTEEALSWLKKAQASYAVLGDEAQGQVLAARIEEVKKKLSNSSS